MSKTGSPTFHGRFEARALAWGRSIASRRGPGAAVAVFASSCALRVLLTPAVLGLGTVLWLSLVMFACVFIAAPMILFALCSRLVQWCLGRCGKFRLRNQVGRLLNRMVGRFEKIMEVCAVISYGVSWWVFILPPASYVFALEKAMCLAFAARPEWGAKGRIMGAMGCNPYLMSALTNARVLGDEPDDSVHWLGQKWPKARDPRLAALCARRVGLYGWLRGFGVPWSSPRDGIQELLGDGSSWLQMIDSQAEANSLGQSIEDPGPPHGPSSKPRL